MKLTDRQIETIKRILDLIYRNKRTLVALSCVVVFITTYMLILPALTLEKDEAAEQGGISLETTATEEVTAEEAAGTEPAETAEEQKEETPQVQTAGETEAGKVSSDSEKTVKDSSAVKSETAEDPLTFEGENFTIAVADDASQLPAGTRIDVQEIAKDDKEYTKQYDELYKESLKALQKEEGKDKVADLGFAKFYDISLLDGKTEVQPDKSVNVTIEYDKALQKELVAEKTDNVRIIHFVKDEKTGELKPEILENKKVEANTNSKDKLTDTTFEAEGFSVYAVVYTVDFEYEDPETGEVYAYSIEGGSSIKLSTLAEILGISEKGKGAEFVSEVSEVTFSDPSLITVTKDGEDWTLKSLKAFDTEESLAITMKDGSLIEVKVTDEQPSQNLADYLVNVSIEAPVDENGAYIIENGDTYNITLRFKEDRNRQFPNSGELVYNMPAGLNAIDGSGSLGIKVTLIDGTTITVPNNNYTISNGQLVFHWSEDDSISQIFAANNTSFSINIEGSFDEDATVIHFSDTISKDIKMNNESSVTAYKVGEVQQYNNKIKYTVSVQSSGTSKNVVVSDTITGEGLTLDHNNISITSNKSNPVSTTGGPTGNSFSYTIPEMKNGEIITLVYYADIDPASISMNNGKVVTVANNSVNVVSEGDPEGDTKHTTNTIDYTPNISKKSNGATSQVGNTTTMSWTITANPNPKVSMAGGTITDTISSESQSIMKYSGTGIQVVVKDKAGNVKRTDTVSWSDLGVDTSSATSWTYTIPESDRGKAYSYEINYTTDVDTTGLTQPTSVKNHGTTNGGKDAWAEGPVGPTGGDQPIKEDIKKTVENVDLDKKEVTWKATITVPEGGLNSAVVTEYYPTIWVDDGIERPTPWGGTITGYQAFENVIEGSVDIEGLQSNEDKTIDYYDGDPMNIGSPGRAVITFYKDKNGTPGLNGGVGLRTITITFKTVINDDWLEDAKDYPYKAKHLNRIDLNGTTSTAETEIHGQEISKTATPDGTRVVNGVELPIYKYELVIKGASSPNMVIEDSFDTSILEPFIPKTNRWDGVEFTDWSKYPFVLLGGDQSYQGNTINSSTEKDKNGNPAPEAVPYLLTDTGIRLVTNADCVPVNGNNMHPVYKLTYYLTVKDEAALQRLMAHAAASEDGKYTLTNTVDWNGHTDTGNVTFEYKGLEKEILTSDSDLLKTDEEIYADFRITLNPGGQILNEMEPLTMTDTFKNLSIVYDSIEATPSEGVSWDFSGNTATFTIPDATKVIITYRARIVRSTGENEDIQFENTAEMKGYKGEIHKTAYFRTEGHGMAFHNSIKLLKYEAGDMTHTLQGAVFALYNGKDTGRIDDQGYPIYEIDLTSPVLDKDGNIVTFTTDNKGSILVYGDENEDGWSLYYSSAEEINQYYLREIVAPPGYMLSDFDYSFRISSDGTTDYDHYLYHAGDTMSAKNYPGTDVRVNKVWSDADTNTHESDSVTVALQQRIQTGTDESGSIIWGPWNNKIREEDNNYAWVDTPSKTIVLNSENDWGGAFNGLPLVVPTGEDFSGPDAQVEYRVVETAVNDEPPNPENVEVTGPSMDGGAYVYTITNTVIKEEGYELPHTGGIGTTLFYIIGSLLVLSSVIYFISRKRISGR